MVAEAETETDPSHEIGGRLWEQSRELCCECLKVEAVFGRTAAHDVGKV